MLKKLINYSSKKELQLKLILITLIVIGFYILFWKADASEELKTAMMVFLPLVTIIVTNKITNLKIEEIKQ